MEPDSEETIQLKIIDETKLEKVSSLHYVHVITQRNGISCTTVPTIRF
jgi:hypothetical protein